MTENATLSLSELRLSSSHIRTNLDLSVELQDLHHESRSEGRDGG